MRNLLRIAALVVALAAVPAGAGAVEIAPFRTMNQSPLVQLFGLPAPGPARVPPAGTLEGGVAEDMASNFAQDATGREEILLDGESYRTTFFCRYGVGGRGEVGLELPLVGHTSGIFDGFIEGWHDFFNLPQGGRKEAPRNRLLYRYTKDGRTRLLLDDSGYGLGDIRLTGGWQLYQSDAGDRRHALTLRTGLKLPTGSSRWLRGSGSTDLALWLTGQSDYLLPGPWGGIAFFASLGGMAMTGGDVLASQQRDAAGFGSLGFGWAPFERVAFKLQLSGHTPFYGDSDLRELASPALQFIIGGTISLSPRTALDIGVSEDIAVNTSSDVALHLALSRRF